MTGTPEPVIGTPIRDGIVPTHLRLMPPNGATRMPAPLVLTKCIEILPARAASSAQSPIPSQMTAVSQSHDRDPMLLRFLDAQIHGRLAHHLAETKLAIDNRRRQSFSKTTCKDWLAWTLPFPFTQRKYVGTRITPCESWPARFDSTR